MAGQSNATTGGPDAFGYQYADQASGAVYNYIDIVPTGIILGTADDLLIPTMSLGAPFTFYGQTITQVRPSTNGFITSTTGTSSDLGNDCPIPFTPTGGGFRIAPFHDDLISTVYYQYLDEAAAAAAGYPGQTAGISVFQWVGELFPAGGGDAVNVETILFHGNNSILMMFAQATGNGAGSTTGIQNANATIGLNYSCNTPGGIVPGTTAILFTIPPPTDSNCCTASANGSGGCTDATCSSTVCAANPACCSGVWNAACVLQAETLCGPLCNTCGDSVVTALEACDTGGATATCDADCTLPLCGDGTFNAAAGEACDDGGESAGCNANCTVAQCGDGTVNGTAGEQCDDSGESATCNADCSTSVCGDQVLNATAGEACDDGGESATCNADCSVASCGDGVVNASAGEACDDAGPSATCDVDCSLPGCGDGAINMAAGETCDDGGQTATCDADCSAASCGDGFVNAAAGELCDEGGETATCDGDCTPAMCGDNTLNATAGEACDDGNTQSGDGCSANCEVESGTGGGGTGGGGTGGTAGTGGAAGTGGSPSTGGSSGDGGAGGGTDSAGEDDGCSCSTQGQAPSPASWLLALGVGAALGRRRRNAKR